MFFALPQAPQLGQWWLHSVPWCPVPALPSSSPVTVGSVFTWTAGVTCTKTVWMGRMRKTVVWYTSSKPNGETKQWNTNISVTFYFPLSSSGLYHVSMDAVESVQCVLRSGLLVPSEGHTEGGSAWRGLWWSPVWQPSLLPSSMSRSTIFLSCNLIVLCPLSLYSPSLLYVFCSWWPLVWVDRVVRVWCPVWRGP